MQYNLKDIIILTFYMQVIFCDTRDIVIQISNISWIFQESYPFNFTKNIHDVI